MKIDALGFVEARGLVTAIVAADAMIKSANVKLIRQQQLDPRLITLVVEGDLAACRAAVDAGVAAGSRVGEVVSRLEIGRPDGDTGRMVLDLIGRSKEEAPPPGARKPTRAKPAQAAAAGVAVQAAPVAQPQTSGGEASLQQIVEYIAESPKGRTWNEIIKHFPEYVGQKQGLEELLEGAQVHKSGNRYVATSK